MKNNDYFDAFKEGFIIVGGSIVAVFSMAGLMIIIAKLLEYAETYFQ